MERYLMTKNGNAVVCDETWVQVTLDSDLDILEKVFAELLHPHEDLGRSFLVDVAIANMMELGVASAWFREADHTESHRTELIDDEVCTLWYPLMMKLEKYGECWGTVTFLDTLGDHGPIPQRWDPDLDEEDVILDEEDLIPVEEE